MMTYFKLESSSLGEIWRLMEGTAGALSQHYGMGWDPCSQNLQGEAAQLTSLPSLWIY